MIIYIYIYIQELHTMDKWQGTRYSLRQLQRPLNYLLDYCSHLWGTCNKTLREKLQKFQNQAARIITGASYEIRSADVLRSLDWENLETRWYLSKATFVYKVLNNSAAPTLKDSFLSRSILVNNYNLRNSQTDLALSKPKREFLKKKL